MNRITKMKKEYESISASDDFKMKIKNTLKKEMGKYKMFKKFSVSVASIAAVAVLTFNFIPNLAIAARNIPLIGEMVNVITFGRFEVKDKGFEATVVTPKIEGLLDKELEDRLNNEFKDNAQAVINAFEEDVKSIKAEFGDSGAHLGVEANYTVRTDNENILALDVYIVNTAASSSTKHTFYNIDKKSGKLLDLKDMFKENADYTARISDYVKNEMIRINDNEDGMFWIGRQEEGFDGFEKIGENQGFYINNDENIVICFNKYEVAAGAQGCPEFVIPNEVISDILK